MGILEIYQGSESWSDYISLQPGISAFGRPLTEATGNAPAAGPADDSVRVDLNQSDYQVALESGLGALQAGFCDPSEGIRHTLVFGFDKLAAGIDTLGADFNLLMGDLI